MEAFGGRDSGVTCGGIRRKGSGGHMWRKWEEGIRGSHVETFGLTCGGIRGQGIGAYLTHINAFSKEMPCCEGCTV